MSNNVTFFFYNKETEEKNQFTTETLIEGFNWCLKILGYFDKNSEFDKGNIVLKTIVTEDKEIFRSSKPLINQLYRYNLFIFKDKKFLDKSNFEDRCTYLFPKDGWIKDIDIFDTTIMHELVDSNYYIENEKISVNLNYLRSQIFYYMKIWLQNLLEYNYLSYDNYHKFNFTDISYVMYSDEDLVKIYKFYSILYNVLQRVENKLKADSSFDSLISTYVFGPQYIMKLLKGKNITTRDAKYMENIYKLSITENFK